jgi:uncharacterized phiE125 gp8 family phage protein
MSTIKYIDAQPTLTPTWPVTLQEVKDKLLIDYTDHDSKLERFIRVATGNVEAFCHISIVEKSVSMYVDIDAGELFELPLGPVASVTSVAKLDGNDEEDTLVLDTDYRLIGAADTFRILKSYYEGIHVVEYTTGYVTCPDSLKEAVLSEVAWIYQNPGDENKGVCETARELAHPYIRIAI